MEQLPHAPLIKLWADGFQIEKLDTSDMKWKIDMNPTWDKENQYRVAQCDFFSWKGIGEKFKALAVDQCGAAYLYTVPPEYEAEMDEWLTDGVDGAVNVTDVFTIPKDFRGERAIIIRPKVV